MSIENHAASSAFAPEALAAMSEALEEATRVLEIRPDEQGKRDIVAQLIIQAALADRDLNAAGLCKKAVLTFSLSSA
jgi:hypothetical protein